MNTTFKVDQLIVQVYGDRRSMGAAAAGLAIRKIREVLAYKDQLNVVFAAAPSQNEFLAGLVEDKSIDWTKVNAFHMDEYLGLDEQAPQLFGNFLKKGIFSHKPFRSVNYINGQAKDVEAEAARYTALLNIFPADIVFMGIGENTHLAFNDPGDADFDDPETVKQVPLDQVCRQQQVNDGCFNSLREVPEYALTITIPALFRAPSIICMVPGKTKADAVFHTLAEPVSDQFPSTILRTHPSATLFIDEESYSRYKHL